MADAESVDTYEEMVEVVRKYVVEEMCASGVRRDSAVDKSINWTPSIAGKLEPYRKVGIEVSTEKVYPMAVRIAHPDVQSAAFLLDVYVACPAELLEDAAGQREQRELRKHGVGLMVVDRDGSVHRQYSTIPLVQQIPENQIREQIHGLPKNVRRQAWCAYENYKVDPVSGVGAMTLVVEGCTFSAARNMYRKGWLSTNPDGLGFGKVINVINGSGSTPKEIYELVPRMHDVRERCRNTSHHAPKSYRQARERALHAKRGFELATDTIREFCKACRANGVTVRV